MTTIRPTTTLPPAGAASAAPRRLWFLDQLFTYRATAADTDGAEALMEILAPPGAIAPPHVHSREDEWFLVLEGRMRIRVGDRELVAGPGGFVHCPRGVPHAYVTEGPGTTRVIGAVRPAGFEAFFGEVARPASGATLPPPGLDPPDPERLAEAAARYGVRMLPPGD